MEPRKGLLRWIVIPTLFCVVSEGAGSADVGESAVHGSTGSIANRIAGRTFPSVFEAWNPAQNLEQSARRAVPLAATESPAATTARHDLYFGGWNSLGLKLPPDQHYVLMSPQFTPESIEVARQRRAALLAANPNMVILAEVHYYSGGPDFLPQDSHWWRHNSPSSDTLLNFTDATFQDEVATLCSALVRTGVYDGCMLDWWHDDDQAAERLSLIRKIRAAVGEEAILIGNVNARLPERTAGYLNGMYLEGFGGRQFPDWRQAATNLLWGEAHLRKPVLTALEGWWETGRDQLRQMREVTTLSLVFSNGYVLFSDPNSLPTPDHLHDWYPFLDKSLGHPVGPLARLDQPTASGTYTRQFERGAVVFNPPSNRSVSVSFPQPRRSAATGVTGRTFTVEPGDGDLFLQVR